MVKLVLIVLVGLSGPEGGILQRAGIHHGRADELYLHRGPASVLSGAKSGFDSLNVRFVGNWPFGAAYAVTCDSVRNLVFLGSGGGIYILDVSNPASPVYAGEIHTRGSVNELYYDGGNERLFVADGRGGLEIWDVSDVSHSQKLGVYYTPGWAKGVYVTGNYAYVADGGWESI